MEVLDKVSAGCGLSGLLEVYNCQRYSDYLVVVVVAVAVVVVIVVVVVVHSSWKYWIKSVPAVVCLVYWMSTIVRDTLITLLL